MAKKPGFLVETMLSIAVPKAMEWGAEKLVQWLDDAYADNPELVKTLTVSLYPFIDIYVEGYVQKTKAKWDDTAVDEIMEAIEEFANKHSISLPQLDSD